MDDNNKQQASAKSINNEPVLPNFGLAIAQEKPTLQLCKPKLLPLKTYSYMRMQIQAKNRLDQTSKPNDIT